MSGIYVLCIQQSFLIEYIPTIDLHEMAFEIHFFWGIKTWIIVTDTLCENYEIIIRTMEPAAGESPGAAEL